MVNFCVVRVRCRNVAVTYYGHQMFVKSPSIFQIKHRIPNRCQRRKLHGYDFDLEEVPIKGLLLYRRGPPTVDLTESSMYYTLKPSTFSYL